MHFAFEHLKCMRGLARTLAAASTAILAIAEDAEAQKKITISSGAASGVYYAAGDAICRSITARLPDFACSVVASEGSVANVMALNPASIQFAIVQSDVQANAYAGKGLFAGAGADPNLRSVLSLHAEALTVVARADAPFRLIGELKGRKLNIGPMGTGVRETAEDLLIAFSWSADERANLTALSSYKAAVALCAGEIDAVAHIIGHPSNTIQEVSKLCPVKILSMQPAAVKMAHETASYYTAITIPAGLYPNQTAPVTTLGVRATLVTSAQVPEDVVQALTLSAFEGLDLIKRSSPALSALDSSQMVRSALTAPWHPGALKYYAAKELVSAEEIQANAARMKSSDARAQAKQPSGDAGRDVLPKLELDPGKDDGLSNTLPEERRPKPWEGDDKGVFGRF